MVGTRVYTLTIVTFLHGLTPCLTQQCFVDRNELKTKIDACVGTSPDGSSCTDNNYGAISNWCVSQVTDMNSLFNNAAAFNQDISAWDVSQVTDMEQMFHTASAFNQDISAWDVGRVTNMEQMFHTASAFNQNLYAWNVSRVTRTNDMFIASPGDIPTKGLSTYLTDEKIKSEVAVASTTNWVLSTQYVVPFEDYTGGDDGKKAGDFSLGTSDFTFRATLHSTQRTIGSIVGRHESGDSSGWLLYLRSDGYITLAIYGLVTDDGYYQIGAGNDHTPVCVQGSDYDSSQSGKELTSAYSIPLNVDTDIVMDKVGTRISLYVNGEHSCTAYLNFIFEDDDTCCGCCGTSKPEKEIAIGAHYHEPDSTTATITKFVGTITGAQISTTLNVATDQTIVVSPSIGLWNVGRITNMDSVFMSQYTFNEDISAWDVSNVTTMANMFRDATAFNQDISSWDVSKVTNMDRMFFNANAFNTPLCSVIWETVEGNLDVSQTNMFTGADTDAGFVCDEYNANRALLQSDLFACIGACPTQLLGVGAETKCTGECSGVDCWRTGDGSGCVDLDAWDVSNVTDMRYLFYNARAFNQDLSSWNVSQVTNMKNMFNAAYDFNQDISAWDVGRVTNMRSMFNAASSFNQDISVWDVGQVTTMQQMFAYTNVFNQDLSAWDVSNVNDMGYMFINADAFNGNVSTWDVSKVTTMQHMFNGASVFNQPLYGWDVSRVTDMNRMFLQAYSFNQDISAWDVGRVTNMRSMFNNIDAFNNANAFNQDISAWDVSQVTTMHGLFAGNAAFNQDISAWNVSQVTTMDFMFKEASAFDQALCGEHWRDSTATKNNMFIASLGTIPTMGCFAALMDVNIQSEVEDYIDGPPPPIQYVVPFADYTGIPGKTAGEFSLGTTDFTFRATVHPTQSQYTTIVARHESGDHSGWTLVIKMDGYIRMTIYGLDTDDGYEQYNGGNNFNPACVRWIVTNANAAGMELTSAYSIPLNVDTDIVMDRVGTRISLYVNGEHSCTVTMASTFNDDDTCCGGSTQYKQISVGAQYLHPQDTAANHGFFVGNITGAQFSTAVDLGGPANVSSTSISAWDVSRVTNMNSLFMSQYTFNKPLGEWDVSRVTTMVNMFHDATAFNQDISAWDVSKVTNMDRMFCNAVTFNADISTWDVSRVTSMSYMFSNAVMFNANLSTWDVSSVTSMSYMFNNAVTFNVNVTELDMNVTNSSFVNTTVANVTDVYGESLLATGDLTGWDVSRVTDMAYMFNNASAFSAEISAWDVSSVTDMTYMFAGASAFSAEISAWDVSSVTDMTYMFAGASAFSADLSAWDVSSVTDMTYMFAGASAFYSDLSAWDVSSVTNMAYMFHLASIAADLSAWDVSRVTSMEGMFYYAYAFDADLSAWNVTSVTSFVSMFEGAALFSQQLCGATWLSSTAPRENMFAFTQNASIADRLCPMIDITVLRDELFTCVGSCTVFNDTDIGVVCTVGPWLTGDGSQCFSVLYGDISEWDVSRVTDMNGLFAAASAFNQPLAAWNVSRVTDMHLMFQGASAFNQPLAAWNVSRVTNMRAMFHAATAFNQPLAAWNVDRVTNMRAMFQGAVAFNQPLAAWDVGRVTNMRSMFNAASSFNQDISAWDVSNVTTMQQMFAYAFVFNQSLDTWDVSNVNDMSYMFTRAYAFNGDVSTWDVSGVLDVVEMFHVASSFNRDVSQWDVRRFTDTRFLFAGASAFNQPLNTWNVDRVTTMVAMFNGAIRFNQDISTWDVSKVTTMQHMFDNAAAFNQALSVWDVGNVTRMERMFSSASVFNGDLFEWDVSRVSSMRHMFANASAFNRQIYKWDVGEVTDITSMFHGASTFDRYLGTWDVGGVSASTDVFTNSGMFNTSLCTDVWEGLDISPAIIGDCSTCVYGAPTYVKSETDRCQFCFAGFHDNPCTPIECTHPGPTDGYDLTRASGELFFLHFEPTRVTCANGYVGTVAYTRCSSHQTPYTLSGCTSVPCTDVGTASEAVNDVNKAHCVHGNAVRVNSICVCACVNGFSGADCSECGVGKGSNGTHCVECVRPTANTVTSHDAQCAAQECENGYGVTADGVWEPDGNTSTNCVACETGFGSPQGTGQCIAQPCTESEDSTKTGVDGQMFCPFGTVGGVTGDCTCTCVDGFEGSECNVCPRGFGVDNGVCSACVRPNVNNVTGNDVPCVEEQCPVGYGFGPSHEGENTVHETPWNATGENCKLCPNGYGSVQDGTVTSTDDTLFSDDDQCPPNACVASSQTDADGTDGRYYCDNGGIVSGVTAQCACTCPSGFRTQACIPNQCTCVNGNGTVGEQCPVHSNSVCATCAPRYELTGTVCVQKQHTCTNGVASTSPALVAGSENCTSCVAGFHVEDLMCRINQCTCANGTAAAGTECETHAAEECAIAFAVAEGDDVRNITRTCVSCNLVNAFGTLIPIALWNMSGVSAFDTMFSGNTPFNADIAQWDVSHAVTMHAMFKDTPVFNRPLPWDVSRVTSMHDMFSGASSFNQDVSNWDVSSVTSMHGMFQDAVSFDNALPWDVSRVTSMQRMFSGASSFNQDVSNWDVSGVTHMQDMFKDAVVFDRPLPWNVSRVTSMQGMFDGAVTFQQPLPWDVSRVTSMEGMFRGAASFNQWISRWDVSRVTSMRDMFQHAVLFNDGYVDANGTGFGLAYLQGVMTQWDVSRVTNMQGMFHGALAFNRDVSTWDVSRVTNMQDMFHGAVAFSQDVSLWRVSAVTNMRGMFKDVPHFNQDLSLWDVSRVTNMESMFHGAAAFNSALDKWNVINVKNMNRTFHKSISFNQDVRRWDVRNVLTIDNMFSGASSFQQDISRWNVRFVRDSASVFTNTDMGPQEYCGEWHRVVSLAGQLGPVSTSDTCSNCVCPNGVPVDECTSTNGTNCVECDDGYALDIVCVRLAVSAGTRSVPWPLNWFI